MQIRLALAGLVFLLCVGNAAEPIGRLTCAGPVKLAGSVLPVNGVPAWAILRGDEVETLAEPATIVLDDRTRIVLAERSRLVVSKPGKSLRVTLLEGALDYRRSPESATAFFDRGRELPVQGHAEARLVAGRGRVDQANGPPETRPPPHAESRSASAPGQVNK